MENKEMKQTPTAVVEASSPIPENATSLTSTPTKGTGPGGSSTSVEFEPPLACVRRMLKNTLPSSTNVGKDASAAFSRACGIFVIYLTACANDFARESKRQTITAGDILKAVKECDFDEFTPQLNEFLENHRKLEKQKRDLKKSAEDSVSRKKRKDSQDTLDDDNDDMEEPVEKRQKLDESLAMEDSESNVNESMKVDDSSSKVDEGNNDDPTEEDENES